MKKSTEKKQKTTTKTNAKCDLTIPNKKGWPENRMPLRKLFV